MIQEAEVAAVVLLGEFLRGAVVKLFEEEHGAAEVVIVTQRLGPEIDLGKRMFLQLAQHALFELTRAHFAPFGDGHAEVQRLVEVWLQGILHHARRLDEAAPIHLSPQMVRVSFFGCRQLLHTANAHTEIALFPHHGSPLSSLTEFGAPSEDHLAFHFYVVNVYNIVIQQ